MTASARSSGRGPKRTSAPRRQAPSLTSNTKKLIAERVAAGRTEDEATQEAHAGHVFESSAGLST